MNFEVTLNNSQKSVSVTLGQSFKLEGIVYTAVRYSLHTAGPYFMVAPPSWFEFDRGSSHLEWTRSCCGSCVTQAAVTFKGPS